ncbi:MAG: excinuclease ABC subunit UvrC [Clostridia bacterium]|nr:excinuclease ABC subunit UvrC [Clostridia bacterium]
MALPLLPGVYLMFDAAGTVIYVGKAKALKNRVSQYFGSDTAHTEKVRQMVAHVDRFETILADSEFEALVLECSLIKQYSPKYNILLKDDKGYSYLRVTPPPYSRISDCKQKQDDGATYIGPYMSSLGIRQAVDEASKVFGLATCNRKFAYGRRPLKTERPCLNYHMGQCCAPCTGKISEADYAERVAGALELILHGSSALLRDMQRRMNEAAEALEFEKAAQLRDRMAAIRRMSEKQKVVSSRVAEQDVLALAEMSGRTCIEVFHFTEGRLSDKEEFVLDVAGDPAATRSEFLRRYYTVRDRVPAQITLDGATEDGALLERWLTEKAGRRVRLVVPQRGDGVRLVEMCRRNAEEALARQMGMHGHDAAALKELKDVLGLSEPPRVIECYDISHTAGENAVGGMVVFENGRPCRQSYRRFRIRQAAGGDDPAAMREVLSRRLNEYELHSREESGFGRRPDLILLDGGAAQVAAVQPLLAGFGWDVPLFGLVKDGRHRTRAVVAEGGELSVSGKRSAFTLLASIQEEVHRYAIGYHRKLRGKKPIGTVLTSIEGVGPSKASALLKRFGSVKAVRAASVEELCTVKGISKPLAERIANALQYGGKQHGTDTAR